MEGNWECTKSSSREHPTKGSPPARRLSEGLRNSHQMKDFYGILHGVSDLD
jgi:hypothetical protein